MAVLDAMVPQLCLMIQMVLGRYNFIRNIVKIMHLMMILVRIDGGTEGLVVRKGWAVAVTLLQKLSVAYSILPSAYGSLAHKINH